jgi:phycocyanobilin lyase subunit alpha
MSFTNFFDLLDENSTPSQDSPQLTVESAIANLTSADPGQRYYASWWLGRFRINTSEAINGLIATLSDETDRTIEGGYPLRRNSARALGKLGSVLAVPPLIECLNCEDYYVREAAAQSLAILSDSVAIPALIKLLDGGLETAQPTPGCPHLAQPYDAILEALGALGAVEAIDLIKPFLTHSTELVQYSAARAMYQLSGEVQYGEILLEALKGDRLQLRRAALADIGAIGFLPAAEMVAKTLAENSLKILSLKGLLEHVVREEGIEPLPQKALQLIMLMDDLL